MMQELGVRPATLDQGMVIVCTRAADFDPADNVLWELDANKSAVRSDIHCSGCGSILAMSNDAYARYTALDKKPKACCIQCLPALAQRSESRVSERSKTGGS